MSNAYLAEFHSRYQRTHSILVPNVPVGNVNYETLFQISHIVSIQRLLFR